jgi:hypothetical protein
MSRNCLVSVATYSYLTRAFVMAETYAAYNPDCEIILLIPDMSQAQIDSIKWPSTPLMRLSGLDTLGHPMIGKMKRYFNAMELCCALKSFLMHHVLFVEGYDRAVMLDPDVVCYASFDRVWAALVDADIVLTPHVSVPPPQDGEQPDDMEFVTAGFINAGFMAARKSEGAKACMDWMMRKLPDFGFFAPQFNAYADQALLSCLPWYFPDRVYVDRDAGLNVAYWNLHERRLTKSDEKYFSSGQPLVFFHYSGFDPTQSQDLTKHSGRRFNLMTNVVISNLLENYQILLKEVGSQMPILRPDSSCSTLPLHKRLTAFKRLRGIEIGLAGRINTIEGKLARFFRAVVRKSREIAKT